MTTLLEKAYAMACGESPRSVVRFIFNEIDKALSVGQFEWCDQVLQEADAEKLTFYGSVALITSTLPARDKLKNRAGFYSRVNRAFMVNDNSLSGLS